MFVDEVVISAQAGNGGDGCSSFRREKYVPMGGPDGGNGGKGGNIVFLGDKSLKTLVDFKYKKTIKAKKGENGKGSNRYGAQSDDIILRVPLGTTIIDNDTGKILADITEDNQKFIACKGGRGGRGNKAFATKNNTAPTFSEKGEPGEKNNLKLSLSLIADIGLIGMPSVGKSTILSLLSAAKPKIASYHFTTLSPNLGVVNIGKDKSFVMADLPGLIEGASKGLGLGDKFLKHASRTKILAHVLDMGSNDPISDYEVICNEIKNYNEKMMEKQMIVIANKMDLPEAEDNLKKFKKKYKDLTIVPISAVLVKGLDVLVEKLFDILSNIKEETPIFDDTYVYEYKKEKDYEIKKEEDAYIISGSKIEKLVQMTRLDNEEATARLARIFKKMGIDDELSKMGAKKGSVVKVLDIEFEIKE